MSGEVRKKFQMTNLTMPNNSCSLKYALKSVSGFADVGDPHGGEDCSRILARGSGSKFDANHVDQCKKLREWDG